MSTAVPERRHTHVFLAHNRRAHPCHIDTEVDMTGVVRDRAAGGASFVSYVILAAGRVMARRPDANVVVRGRIAPRVTPRAGVDVKLAVDTALRGRRIVATTVIRDAHLADLAGIQKEVARLRDLDVATAPEYAGVRLLHRLPVPLGRLLFGAAARRGRLGTVAVSSLGHRPVNAFFACGGPPVTLGVGRVRDIPAVRDGRVAVVPGMRLSLTFDHRVIDGAEAADILADLKRELEADAF
ncbi:2-oxo acid dehydrogenase subunit E2 [Actinomadura viridis]|uniref:Pyruvate/2-oxoglutarate dehydrogenase complex dihydrolipoamide acyltransferase (E2) component n=1 Tax=Actinomadura viridis TaxID=58110 RepID=A0A931GGY3_9ACTN|nr:2-oxo acid dehydrogenase subunit E2 [Actinomadura viridis]MBG6086840.1 pyruvate/2-oxoglutarate dehydrogenase complex dihydrolipoamide acyltransferase (E2) component [Actinomadura viridis]